MKFITIRELQTIMRAWLFVLAVLATQFLTVQQVASTEEVRSSSKSSSSNSESSYLIAETTSSLQTHQLDSSALDSSSYSNSVDNSDNLSNNNNNDNNMNGEKPDPQTLVQIEKNLLSLFGFTHRPKVDRSKIVIPEAMKQLYAQIMGHELDSSINVPKAGLHTKKANTIRSFTHEESKIDDRFKFHHRFRLHFNVSNIPQNEQLKAAELTLNRNQIENADEVRHQIFVYDIVRPGNKIKQRKPIFLLVDSKTVSVNESGAVTIDVLPAVKRWLREPKKNHGLLVHIASLDDRHTVEIDSVKQPEHQHIRLRRSIDEKPEKWAHAQPLLFTYTDDGRYKQRSIRDAIKGQNQNRNRRAPGRRGHRRKDHRDICQRRPLYVDFSDVGWNDWIVAPPGYEAFYCHGECNFPIADHLNTTNHAIVQTLVNSLNPSLAPKACCVPTQLSSICMLYLDDQGKVVLKNYQDMTVVGCGCR